jgi:hypothetical protein
MAIGNVELPLLIARYIFFAKIGYVFDGGIWIKGVKKIGVKKLDWLRVVWRFGYKIHSTR